MSIALCFYELRRLNLTSDVFTQDKSGDKNVPLFPRPLQPSLWTGRA